MTAIRKLSLVAVVLFLLYPNAAQGDSGSQVLSGTKARPVSGAGVAKKWLGVVLGTLVGVPICAVRKPFDEEKYGIAEMSREHHQLRVTIPAAIYYFPIAVMTGVFEAPYWGFGNSMLNYGKPFSKEQFSLGDMQAPPAGTPAESGTPAPSGTQGAPAGMQAPPTGTPTQQHGAAG